LRSSLSLWAVLKEEDASFVAASANEERREKWADVAMRWFRMCDGCWQSIECATMLDVCWLP
jgi:hypothetical protein